MSTVYGGWDAVIERRVAIKAVPLVQGIQSEGWQHLIRFKREAQAAGRLQHPAVVGIFDYGEQADSAFIIMEFVDGGTLKSALDGGKRFSIGEIDRLLQDVLAGLQYSHDQGVIHRDIKPANIMLTRDGRAKIADFGIARLEHSDITQVGMIMGTPAYMSPEQFMGETVGPRTDIYSAGVILYELLTGDRPFDGGLATIMHKALKTDPPKPSDISGTVPHAADAVVARAMAKRPDHRFQNAREFAQALHDALVMKPAKSARWSRGAFAARIPIKRVPANLNKHLVMGASLAALAAVGGAAAYWLPTSQVAVKPASEAQKSISFPPAQAVAGGTPAASGRSGQINGTTVLPASNPGTSRATPQTAPLDPTPTLPSAPVQAMTLPAIPLAAPALPTPDIPARVPAPSIQAPAISDYSTLPAAPSTPPTPPQPPRSVRKETRNPTPRSVVRQANEAGGDDTPPPQAAQPEKQLGGPRAERLKKEPAGVADPTGTTAGDTTAASSTPLLPQESPFPRRILGTYGTVNGRRVLVPSPGSDQ